MEGVYQPNLAHTTLYGEAPYFLFLVYYHMPHELKDSEEFDLDFRHCEPTDKKESSLILTHHKTGWKTEVLARNRAEVRAIMNEFFSNFYNNNND